MSRRRTKTGWLVGALFLASCGDPVATSSSSPPNPIGADGQTTGGEAQATTDAPPSAPSVAPEAARAVATKRSPGPVAPRTHAIGAAARVLAWRTKTDPARHVTSDAVVLAARGGDVSALRRIIEESDRRTGFNRDYPTFREVFMERDSAGWTALHHAAFSNQATVFKALQELRVLEPDWPTGSLATSHGLNPWDVRPVDENDRNVTSLHLAAMEGHSALVESMLGSKRAAPAAAPVDPATHNPWSAERLEAMRPAPLAADVGRVDCDRLTALHYALLFNRSSVLELLVRAGADVNASDPSTATLGDDIAAGRVRYSHPSAAMVAVDGNALEGLKWCATKGANLGVADEQGFGLLHHAAMTDDPRIAEWLIDVAKIDRQSPAANEEAVTPLHVAAYAGSLSVLSLLLDRGSLIDDWDANRSTPLHWAGVMGQVEAIELLVARGADVNATNQFDQTPLMIAASGGHAKSVGALLRAGAQVNRHAASGVTALHQAASSGSGATAEALLAGGADIGATDAVGNTPLHVAAASGATEVVNILLAKGSDMNARNQSGWTALDLASMSEGATETVRLLRSKGARLGRDL
jgi:ankyrin repeat protein